MKYLTCKSPDKRIFTISLSYQKQRKHKNGSIYNNDSIHRRQRVLWTAPAVGTLRIETLSKTQKAFSMVMP